MSRENLTLRHKLPTKRVGFAAEKAIVESILISITSNYADPKPHIGLLLTSGVTTNT